VGKLPSEKTQIKNLRYDCSILRNERDSLKIERDKYRNRATKAEQEVVEWKARFDTLLRRDERVSA
jgi:FtsZ-binding cell division protein ZapB